MRLLSLSVRNYRTLADIDIQFPKLYTAYVARTILARRMSFVRLVPLYAIALARSCSWITRNLR